jgi:hypothetical protein
MSSSNRSPNHSANLVIGACLLAGLATGLLVTSWMGEPPDIRTENAPSSSVSTPSSSTTGAYPFGYPDGVACVVPSEDSSTAHCTFRPTSRYDYVGGTGWIEVPSTMRYANGNRPPTGQYLTDHPYPAG